MNVDVRFSLLLRLAKTDKTEMMRSKNSINTPKKNA